MDNPQIMHFHNTVSPIKKRLHWLNSPPDPLGQNRHPSSREVIEFIIMSAFVMSMPMDQILPMC